MGIRNLACDPGLTEAFRTRFWRLAHDRSLTLGPKGLIMAIVNVTPDLFSDGGQLNGVDDAVRVIEKAVENGASIIDIGGEFTRPGAAVVDAATEQARILPVIEAIAGPRSPVISVDTYRSETARMAINAGAHIVNDVWGAQRDADIARVAAETGAGLCLMHTGREREKSSDVVEDQRLFLGKSLQIAAEAGVATDAIVLDPGFGFAKDPEENIALVARFTELHAFGFPLLAGTSRKRFLGTITGRGIDERDVATAATSAILRLKGAAVLRVHEVRGNADAVAVTDAVIASARGGLS